jgi:hypothetical protein
MALPITDARAQQLARWLKRDHGDELATALQGTPFSVDVACAICCQETGGNLLDFLDAMPADVALARCVFDASGDADAPRSAFPRNTAEFRARYDAEDPGFADMLVSEANKSRSLRGLDSKPWIYKAYGLFQYDLQHVVEDEAFFREKRWRDFGECAQRLSQELRAKLQATNDRDQAIRAYNGSGPAAQAYLANVLHYIGVCQAVQA